MAQLKSTIVQGALTVTSNVVANKLIKLGGTSSQILMADGSVTTIGNLITDTGVTSVTVTGSGNAVTSASISTDTRTLTLTKGSTFLTSVPNITVTDSTSATTHPIVGDITSSGHTITVTRKSLADLGLSTVYKYKGTKTWAQLLALTSAAVGDVYNISDADPNGATGMDWACYKAVTAATTSSTYSSYWQSIGGTVDLAGYVEGPASSTDNAIARYHSTTGKVIQNSGVTIDDNNNISTAGSLKLTNNGDILWNSGSWWQRIKITDDSSANTNVFEFQQSSDSGSNYTTLFAIKDNKTIVQGSPSTDSTILNMNRFEADLFVSGNGTAPNSPKVAGFYLGRSQSDENRHMDIVSGSSVAYIDFNRASEVIDFKDRLYVDVSSGAASWQWNSGCTSKTFTFSGGSVTASSFIKSGSSDSYVLLAGGGAKALSDFQTSGSYVTLDTAQTITGIKTFSHSTFGAIILKRDGSTNASSIIFQNNNGILGSIGMTSTVNSGLKRWTADTSSVYTIWDSGNDGSGSGLDADKLDGQEGSYYLNYNNFTNKPTIPTVNNGTLTMNTSGTGVSGSATFTANQSTSSTFTVTLDSSAAGNRGANKVVLAKAAGQIDSDKFTVTSSGTTKSTIQYNTTEGCLEFVFA